MKSENLFNWIQMVTGVAVLVGLGLVIWELRQTRSFMVFELVDRTFSEVLETRRTNLGENPMAAYAKACQGEALSLEDRLILENYFRVQMSLVMRNIATQNMLEFWGAGSDVTAQFAFIQIFQLEEGKRWFESWEKRVSSNQGPALQAALQMARNALQQDVPPCGENYRL